MRDHRYDKTDSETEPRDITHLVEAYDGTKVTRVKRNKKKSKAAKLSRKKNR